jgi:hypothetical protein
MEFKFQGKASGGALKINDRENLVKLLESMEGKNFTMTIKEVKQVRSLGLNAYYWKVVIPRVRLGLIGVGYDADELDGEVVHEYLKSRFLTKEIFSVELDEILKVTERTSKIDNKKFKEFIERIQRWAMEFLHVYIPDPNEGQGLGNNNK